MSLSEGYIYASDINSLKDSISSELSRRNLYSFTNFNSEITASINNSITPDIWNNLINPLNTINADTTNYGAVSKNDEIRALVQLSLARNSFANCPYRDRYGTQSGCSGNCLGMCQSCTGDCTDTCEGCTSCTGCSGGCMSNCADCSGYCYGCPGSCSGGCGNGCSDFCAGQMSWNG